MEYVWFTIMIAVCAAMLYTASRMEPHWASKDGRRSICRGQLIDRHGLARTKWHEYRIEILNNGELVARRRGMFRFGETRWRVVERTPQEGRKAVFVARSVEGLDEMLLVRMPTSSAAVPAFESVAIGR